MKNYKNLILGISMLIAFQGISWAQQEIPDKIKDKITAGINALENAKAPAEIDLAVKEFSEAAAMAPEYADVHYFLGKTLSTMQGSAGQAVKEYKKYLEMYPEAPDKDKVNAEIARLEEVIKTKNKSYLMGISLIELSDGIYIRQVSPNYPKNDIVFEKRVDIKDFNSFKLQAKNMIKTGDKIVKINNVDIKGFSIHSVIKLINEDTSSNKFSEITIMRGGTTFITPMYKETKEYDFVIKDLGEEDLAAIIAEAKIPVVVFFVSDWCELCEKYNFPISQYASRYKNYISFIIANIDESIYLSEDFNISQTPAIYLYKEGKLFDKIMGYDSKLLEKKINVLMK